MGFELPFRSAAVSVRLDCRGDGTRPTQLKLKRGKSQAGVKMRRVEEENFLIFRGVDFITTPSILLQF